MMVVISGDLKAEAVAGSARRQMQMVSTMGAELTI